jgi:hypothetical protein
MRKILGILLVLIVITNTEGFTQTKSMWVHEKLQRELSFYTWEKNQPKVRRKAARSAKKQKKQIEKREEFYTRLKEKENNYKN